jgi:hypothetical protein
MAGGVYAERSNLRAWLGISRAQDDMDWNAGKVIDRACNATTAAWHVLKNMTPTTMAGLFAKVRVLAAEDIIDQEEGDAEDILRMIFGDFAALDAAAQPAQPAAAA